MHDFTDICVLSEPKSLKCTIIYRKGSIYGTKSLKCTRISNIWEKYRAFQAFSLNRFRFFR